MKKFYYPYNKKDLYEYLVNDSNDIDGRADDNKEIVNTSKLITEMTSINDASSLNETTTINDTDNSTKSTLESDTTLVTDTSQKVVNDNTVLNKSYQDIFTSADTTNINKSKIINELIDTTQNHMTNSCGMTIEQSQKAIDFFVDNSINIELDASNIFVATGNNNKVSGVDLNSMIEYIGDDINNSCLIDSVNDLNLTVDSVNKDQVDYEGGTIKGIDLTAGNNTTGNTNTTDKKDQIDQSATNSNSTENTSGTTNANTVGNTNTATLTSSQTSIQSAIQSAALSNGPALGGMIFIFIIGIAYFIYKKMKGGDSTYDQSIPDAPSIQSIP